MTLRSEEWKGGGVFHCFHFSIALPSHSTSLLFVETPLFPTQTPYTFQDNFLEYDLILRYYKGDENPIARLPANKYHY